MSKGRTIGYWATTGLVALAFAAGGAADLAHPAKLTADMATIGYPAYFMTILGFWKVMGALAIVAPRTARLKEWAYAGIVFDLTGASFSHLSSGDDAAKVITPLLILAIAVASWALRPASRTLASNKDAAAEGATRQGGDSKVALAT